MAPKKHGNVKNSKQYEGLRKKGMSKERAAKIASTPGGVEARREEGRRQAQKEVVAPSPVGTT
jgi:hypothetical protein